MFQSNLNKGFTLTFENGLTISVQFGCGNYCDNRYVGYKDHREDESTTSSNAEIAIWDNNNQWFRFENGDEVMGYVTPDNLVHWINRVRNATSLMDC
jgi:hypothetical protein